MTAKKRNRKPQAELPAPPPAAANPLPDWLVGDPPPLLTPEPPIDLETSQNAAERIISHEIIPEKPAPTAPECPDCACRDVRVMRTKRHGKTTSRHRRCRHCGREFWTREVLLEPDSDPKCY